MGGSKGGQSAHSYNYHSTLAGAIAWGPISAIHAVIIDGKSVWEGVIQPPAEPTPPPGGKAAGALPLVNSEYAEITGSIDPKWFLKGGYLRIYWGSPDQTADPALEEHPPYRHVAYLVARHLLLGRERSTAPNIEVIVSRLPSAPTDLVEAAHNTIEDGQINPVAALADLITGQHGLAMEGSRCDGTAWRTAAAWCAHTAWRKSITWCSPLFSDRAEARRAITELLDMFQGALVWTHEGRLGIRVLDWGATDAPVGAIIDARTLTRSPRWQSGGWEDIPSGAIIRYYDHERKAKEADEKVDNLVALRIYGEDRRIMVDRPHVTGSAQARRIGIELLRRMAAPQVTLDIECRGEGITARVGEKVAIDTDPEPGGTGLAQIAVVEERRDDPGGLLRLTCRADTLVPASPYVLDPTSGGPLPPTVDPILHALAIPLPPQGSWPLGSFGLLASRPQADVVGMRVFVSADGVHFANLGAQAGFAVRAALETAVEIGDTTARLSLTDGPDGLDAYLIELVGPAGNEADARSGSLVAVFAALDEDGTVEIDIEGWPVMEFAFIISREAIAPAIHDYAIIRGRHGLAARAWGAGASVWIIPGLSIEPWEHPDIRGLLEVGEPFDVRLTAYSPWAEDTDPTPPERKVRIPPAYDTAPRVQWINPSGSVGSSDGVGDFVLELAIHDSNGDITGVRVTTQGPSGDLTEWEDIRIAPTAMQSLAIDLFGLAPGPHKVIVHVVDARGFSVTDTSRTILGPAGGSTLPLPTLDPAERPYGYTVLVRIETASPADRIQWGVTAVGVTTPPMDTATTPSGTTIQDVPLNAPRRLWARSGDGTDWSGWVWQDYLHWPGY
ncbi:MAG: hypothetical protein KF833_18710 [Verrucomicrobiae bacterium]|nr:hypothetical protein [Verrucomicrobiae bacterium]